MASFGISGDNQQDGAIMKSLHFLIFTLHLASAGSHFLDYFLTGVSPGTSCPEFTGVAHLDGLQAGYYDSNSRTLIFRQEWIKGIKDDEHWNLVAQYMHRYQDTFPAWCYRDLVPGVIGLVLSGPGARCYRSGVIGTWGLVL
ncbi:hypothetical protein NFI96_002446 [Prochilodus magdalenae]|nr:hypothetical protein NFI96_002446 [Prochilodus magdalenae]